MYALIIFLTQISTQFNNFQDIEWKGNKINNFLYYHIRDYIPAGFVTVRRIPLN